MKKILFLKDKIMFIEKWFFSIPIINRYQRIIKYLIGGGTATLVDLVLLFFFTSILHIWYLLSAVLAFIVAYVVSFSFSKFWTFADKSDGNWGPQATIYLIITSTNLGLNTLLMYTFVEFVHFHYLTAQIITSAILACESYFAYQIFVFNKKKI